MDDFIFSVEDTETAQKSIKELIGINLSAGFNTHKIASNNAEALDFVPSEAKLESVSDKRQTSVLGVSWDLDSDEMYVTPPKTKIPEKLSKRKILSIVASYFDPMGFLARFLIIAKFIIQEIWLRDRELKGLELAKSWDRDLPNDLDLRFRRWYQNMSKLENISHKRWIGLNENLKQNLAGFCDASFKGMGAVIYLRTAFPDGKVTFELLVARGKVAPILSQSVTTKGPTIPRLELGSCLLLAELMARVRIALKLGNDFSVQLFTDSEISLAQISSDTIRDVYTENRLRKIRNLFPKEVWFFVVGEQNPADHLTRDNSFESCDDNYENGPPCQRSITFAPENKFLGLNYPFPGLCAVNVSKMRNALETADPQLPFLNKFTKFSETTRIMACVLRATQIFKKTTPYKKDELGYLGFVPLNEIDLRKARTAILGIVQGVYYNEEIKSLKKGSQILTGPLRTKNPFLDKDGILRVGTRIQQLEIAYDERNPIVLPEISIKHDYENHITYQIITEAHLTNIHGGISSTMADIKQRYFVPGLRKGVSGHIKNCQLCTRVRAKAQTQIMGQLPDERVIRNPAFTHVTLDYAGPINLKTKARKLRSASHDDVDKITFEKAWIMIVACFTSGAYHLELVTDLTADAFLKAFNNYVSTRSLPTIIRSDNASTFHRASDMIAEAFEKYKRSVINGNEKIQQFCTSKGVTWRFNPSLASAWGGVHERGVRSLRDKLRKSIGIEKLNFSDMHALLKKIEAVLNDRPLLIVRGVQEDGDFILTPSHLIIGRQLGQFPPMCVSPKNLSLHEAYKIRTKIEKHFWEKYHKFHLQEIAHRTKWHKPEKDLKVGDLVLLHEDNVPPLMWRRGLIDQVTPGSDGKVRLLHIKTATGQFERTVGKVVLLPDIDYKINEIEGDNTTTLQEVQPNVNTPDANPTMDNATLDNTEANENVDSDVNKIAVDPSPKTAVARNARSPTLRAPTLRRSKRIATKTLLAALLLCITIPFSHSHNDTKNPLRVNGSYGSGGAMIYQNSDILISEGIFHIHLALSNSPKKDVNDLVYRYNRLYEYCNITRKLSSCGVSLHVAEERVRDAIEVISEAVGLDFTPQTRKLLSDESISRAGVNQKQLKPGKYSVTFETRHRRDEGWVWRAFRYLFSFGGNTVENVPHERTSGVLIHTVESIKQMEKKLVDHENLLGNEFVRLHRIVDQQISKSTEESFQILDAQFHRISTAIIDYCSRIKKPYGENPVSDSDLMELEREINARVHEKGVKTIPVHLPQLKKILDYRLLYNGSLTLVIGFPLVGFDVFSRVSILPFPDKKTRSIPRFDKTDVIINIKNSQYILEKDAKISKINETLYLAEAPIISLVNENSPCAIRLIFKSGQVCPMFPLPPKFDLWWPTPLHNVFHFASTANKNIFCPSSKEELVEEFGVVVLGNRCYVKTDENLIKGSLEVTKTEKFMAKVEFPDVEGLFNKTSALSNNFSEPLPDNFDDIQPSDFGDLINEALVVDLGLTMFETIMITMVSSILGFILLVGVCSLYWWGRNRKTKTVEIAKIFRFNKKDDTCKLDEPIEMIELPARRESITMNNLPITTM
jgi:hypothetical protein